MTLPPSTASPAPAAPARLSPVRRRILYALLFEGIGLVISTLGLIAFTGSPPATATGAAFGSMVIALLVNYLFNAGFEAWERRQPRRGRSLRRRLAHGALFELTLCLVLVPFLAWWMQIGLVAAFLADLGLIAFFGLYTLAFTWAFDRIFGLPASAR